MRKVFRNTDTKSYWDQRWAGFGQDQGTFQNQDIYPIKYIDPLVAPLSRSLDAGCGLGRIVKFYANQGFTICGCDYSHVAH